MLFFSFFCRCKYCKMKYYKSSINNLFLQLECGQLELIITNWATHYFTIPRGHILQCRAPNSYVCILPTLCLPADSVFIIVSSRAAGFEMNWSSDWFRFSASAVINWLIVLRVFQSQLTIVEPGAATWYRTTKMMLDNKIPQICLANTAQFFFKFCNCCVQLKCDFTPSW